MSKVSCSSLFCRINKQLINVASIVLRMLPKKTGITTSETRFTSFTKDPSYCSRFIKQILHTNIRAYNNSLLMSWVTVELASHRSGGYYFNPTITFHRRIYSYFGALVPPVNLRLCFHSVYTHDADYAIQSSICTSKASRLSLALIRQLTAKLHVSHANVQSYSALRDCAMSVGAPNSY